MRSPEDADAMKSAAEAAAEQARREAIAANGAVRKSLKEHRKAVAAKAEVSGMIEQLDAGMEQLKDRLQLSIESALAEKQAAKKALREKKFAEHALDKGMKTIPIIDKVAKEELQKVQEELTASQREEFKAGKRKELAKKIARKASQEAAYYKELSDTLVQQRAAAQSALEEMNSAQQAQRERTNAEWMARTASGLQA